MSKLGSTIFGKTEGIKPRERTEATTPKIKTSPGMFLDTQHRAVKAEAEIAVLKNRFVQIADLTIVAGRKRQLSEQEFGELKANLAAFPLIAPITIRALPQGGYELISGHNRVEAYKQLGRTEIEANILELREEQVLPAAFYSNLLSPALPDYEKYLGFKQLQQATGKTQTELAKESGVSKTVISLLFAFDELSPASHAVLSTHPQCVGVNLIGKIKNMPKVDEAIAQLATGEITQQQAVLVAAASLKPVAKKGQGVAPVIVKNGKKKFAEISSRGHTAVIRLTDETLMPALMVKLEALIRNELQRESVAPEKL